MGEYNRFKADCWNINMNYEASACLTSQSDDELEVTGTFRTNSDLVGLYWNSKDLIEHDLLKYPTDYDYTGTILSFEFETTNCSLCGGSSLTITGRDGVTYFCDWDTLNPITNIINIPIPNNAEEFYHITEGNLLASEFIVNNSNDEPLTGFAGRGFDLGYDRARGVLVNPKPEETITTTTTKYVPTKHEPINQNGQGWGYTKISDLVIPESIEVHKTENELYLRGGDAWNNPLRDYTFLPNAHSGILEFPAKCIVPCNEEFVTGGGDIYYAEYTLDYSETAATSITLSKNPFSIEYVGLATNVENNIEPPKENLTLLTEDDYEKDGDTINLNIENTDKKIIVKYIDNTQMETITLTFNSERTHIQVGSIREDKTEIRKAGKQVKLTYLDGYDYYYDQNQEVLIQISENAFAGGSITCKQAHGLNLDFDNLIAGGYVKDGEYQYKHIEIDPTSIESIMIPLLPKGFEAYTYKVIPNSNFLCRIHNITVTGNTLLGYEPEFNLTNPYRLAEGYDDTYNLCPRRLAYMMARLGYEEWLDIYIGATHYYEKNGTIGQYTRINQKDPTNDNYKELEEGEVDNRLTYADPLYNRMNTNTNTPLTLAFQTWFDDYCKWSKHYGMNNIIVSISMENLQMPDSWKQLIHDGTPGGTGWVPSTNFFSPTNLDARAYIKKVAEACLDILVDNDLPPILQWGEPWWWWQELYPESISIDPDNQSSNAEKYPGQPPCFYDQATKNKYYAETGKQLPIYTSSSDEYDPEVIAWLRHQLVDYSNFMRSIVKAYDGGIYTALYFPPSIFDTERVPKMMQEVNYPADAWNNGQLDFLQLEDYDWVITDDPQHDDIWSFGQKLNIPNSKIHYFSGYNQYPNDTPRIWPLIKQAAEVALLENMAEVYIWAGTQIRRDNIIMTEPVSYGALSVAKESEIAIPLLNIIILSSDEKVIRWLMPDIADVKEVNEKNTVRKVTITYPLEEDVRENNNPWFQQGNKIFIPSVFGLTNCLYVINTSYTIDYWEDNTVVIEAEEVLTELNYMVTAVYEEQNKINSINLKSWFGQYYLLDKIDSLDGSKDSIGSLGTVTLMTLLRTIEEKTERVFITRYEYRDNKIYRYLSLLKEDTLRQTAGTEYLDLNYNLESLELEVDEEKVYGGMAPLFNIQEKQGTESSDYINWNNSNTSVNAITTTDSKQVYKNWLDLQVGYREYIPMIRQKESDGTVITKSSWYAPFEKRKGELHIENVSYANSIYNHIQPPAQSDKIPNPVAKIGTVSTSETDPYAIYNVLANSLLDKLSTKFTLKIKVKDIADLLGIQNLGYNLYETLYVKVPGFDYYIPGHITKTTKNPHLPGEDTITVETDVKTTHITQDTMIESNDKIIETGEKDVFVGGILKDENGHPVQNQTVSISIRLVEAYADKVNITQSILPFKPESETYQFSKEMIWELEKNLRVNTISKGNAEAFVLTDITGKAYLVPYYWCLSIYYSFIQIYINTDRNLGDGEWVDTLEVHYYPDYLPKLKETGLVDYYPSRFYDIIQIMQNYYSELGVPGKWEAVCSNEIQNGATCVASAVSNITAFYFNYKSESEILKLFGKGPENGLNADEMTSIMFPVLRNLGYNVNVVSMTKENIKKYVGETPVILGVDAGELPMYPSSAKGKGHGILLITWYEVNGEMKCYYFDSNIPVLSPSAAGIWDIRTANCVSVDKLIHSVHLNYVDGRLVDVPCNSSNKCMTVVTPTTNQVPTDMKILLPPANYVQEEESDNGGEE